MLAVLPVLFGFFVMGFCDIVGISSDYAREAFGWSHTMAGFVPSMVFIWFLFFKFVRLLLIQRHSCHIPVLSSIPVCFKFNNMRIIVYHLRLYTLLIVTGIPHSVAIGIVYQPGSVFAGIQIVKLRSPVNHRTPAKNFILIIQQFDKSDRICSGYVEEHITVFFDLTNLEGLLYLIGKQPVNCLLYTSPSPRDRG